MSNTILLKCLNEQSELWLREKHEFIARTTSRQLLSKHLFLLSHFRSTLCVPCMFPRNKTFVFISHASIALSNCRPRRYCEQSVPIKATKWTGTTQARRRF